MALKNHWRKLGQGVLDVFFPRSCLGCGNAVDDSAYRYICPECSYRVCLNQEKTCCRTCGVPFAGEIVVDQICPNCSELAPVFQHGKALMLFRDLSREIVYKLKYENAFYLLPDIRRIITQSPGLKDYLKDAILVPVPLYPTKQRARGFNQSQKLVEILHEVHPETTILSALQRVKDTGSQTRLDRKARQRNVKNAFALSTNVVLDADKLYIIVDDVFTTGSTLNACALVLQKAGARNIRVLSLTHG